MKSIEERYLICKNCLERITEGKCSGKCKEYWKYQGALEQHKIDLDKSLAWLDNLIWWTPFLSKKLKEELEK